MSTTHPTTGSANATFVMPVEMHDALMRAVYLKRGFSDDEADAGARAARLASWHGIKTHNGIKAIELDTHLGSLAGGCVPRAEVERLDPRFPAVERWNANRKMGQAVAFAAMDRAMRLADEFGVGIVAVDNAFHYLWGGGYVIEAALKGYIAYTNCTAAMAEVIPYQGRFPTLGTNPHSWGFPTQDLIGFPICIDWATSTIASGRVAQCRREGKPIPPHAAVDAEGRETIDPHKVKALLPFGAHKGYGLALIDELYSAYTGGSLPTLRSRWKVDADPGEKRTPTFFFQCLRPEALGCDDFAMGRTQPQNVKAVLDDVLGHGNQSCTLPGQPEAEAAHKSHQSGGLLFTAAEIDALESIARDAGHAFDRSRLRAV